MQAAFNLQHQLIPQVLPHNFPLLCMMNCRGDVTENWERLRNYTSLTMKKPFSWQPSDLQWTESAFKAALPQYGQPVAFASRTLSKTEERYSSIGKECEVIVFRYERFNQYLGQRERIYVETDHKPLDYLQFPAACRECYSDYRNIILQSVTNLGVRCV